MWAIFVVFLTDNAVALTSGAAVLFIIEYFFAPFRFLRARFKKPEKTDLSDETIEKLSSKKNKDGPELTVPQFIRLRRELKADLEQELAEAADAEKDQLRARIDELERQIADPEPALKNAKERIVDLEARLEREGNELGGEKLETVLKALAAGDYSAADDLFAEIEARSAIAVQSAARAAFARGEIAEAEVRWSDAAAHYARAAGLEQNLQTLFKAREFAHRAGDYAAALGFGAQALEIARKGQDELALGKALNDHAALLKEQAGYEKAEPLYREAMSITEATLGKAHPTYATGLNNLAALFRATGRYDEAEPLFREAMAITEETLGKAHPDYATRLNNLAGLLETTGRYDEAEPLYREAMSITEATLGKAHPDYAIDLNNFAALLRATGRYEEAEPLYREAMSITEATLGKAHPTYAANLNNLAVLYAETKRVDDALPLMEQALAIVEAALGREHTNTEASRQSLAAMRRAAGQ